MSSGNRLRPALAVARPGPLLLGLSPLATQSASRHATMVGAHGQVRRASVCRGKLTRANHCRALTDNAYLYSMQSFEVSAECVFCGQNNLSWPCLFASTPVPHLNLSSPRWQQ